MIKRRFELPVLKKLKLQFDIQKLQKSYEHFIKGKTWDSLGADERWFSKIKEDVPDYLPICS